MYYFSDTANRPHLKYYTVFTCPDSTGKDSAYITSHALGKIILNNSNNWALGKQPLCTNGDTAVFNVIYYIAGPDKKDSLESAIQFVMNNMPTRIFDTSNRSHNILTSIGQSSVTQLAYLMNTFSSEKFYKNFQTFYPVDFASNSIVGSGTNWNAIKQPLNSWWFSGASGSFPFNVGFTTDAYDSAQVHNPPSRATKLTLLAGQNYSTLTHDSAYYKTGNDATNNPWIWFVDTAGCIDLTQQKIAVDSFMVIDWGDFWGRASYSTYWYFDSQGDPLHGNLIADNTTGNTSIGGGLYYQDVPSNGIVYRNHVTGVDFTRDTSTTMWNVTEVWVYVSNLSATADTIQVILGDSAMSAYQISHLRNNTTPTFNIITTGGCNCWQRVWQGSVNSQHALISYRRHSNGDETAVNGIVFYGHPLPGQGINTYQYNATYANIDTFRQDVQHLTGGNFYNNYDTAYMKSMDHRDGINTPFKGSNDSLIIQAQQDPSSRNYTDSLIKVNYPQVRQYYSWQGPVTKVYNATGDFLQRPVDSIGADFRLPESFFTLGKLMYGEAFSFGNNPSANNSYYKSKGGWIKANNTLYGVEPGNENNNPVFNNYWQDPISMGAMLTMVIDGCNGLYTGYGAKQADPNFKVYSPATATIDLHYQVAVMRYLQYFYHTAHPPIDYFGFHSYPQNAKNGIALNTNQSIGGFIISPSAKGYFQDKVFAIKSMNGYWHGTCPITFSEEGADKSFDRTVTANGQFDTTLAGIQQYTTFNQSQSLAIYQVSCLMLDACTQTAEADIYAYPDFDAPNAQFLYHTFSGSGWIWFYFHPFTFVLDSVKYFDAWYYYQGIAKDLWGYKCVQILDSNSNGLWRLKFRNIANPQLVKWVIWNDNPNNSNIATSIPIGGTLGNVLKKQGQFNSFNLTSTIVTPSVGVLNLTVNSQHTIIEDTEISAADLNYILGHKGHRIGFFSH